MDTSKILAEAKGKIVESLTIVAGSFGSIAKAVEAVDTEKISETIDEATAKLEGQVGNAFDTIEESLENIEKAVNEQKEKIKKEQKEDSSI